MQMTLRNWINLALAGLAGIALAVLSVSACGLDHDSRLAGQTLAGGLLVGLITPGSPVGRALDFLVPPPPPPVVAESATTAPERVQ